jgi:membrane protease YdiL (CAAX protease family)
MVYPFTSQPFTGQSIGMWLISPAAQDLLFTGYLYGLLDTAFPGRVNARLPVNRAVFFTAVFFALWHVPNFSGIQPSYVVFQLAYTFVGGAWVLLARQLTGSVLPGIATHMAVNFIAWAGG